MRVAFKNFLNTVTSFLRTDATEPRTYQFPDKNITVAGVEDITSSDYLVVSGATSLDESAFGKVIYLTGTSADYTVNLPSGIGHDGEMIFFKAAESHTELDKVVTIDDDGVDTINSPKLAAGGYCAVMCKVDEGVAHWNILSFDQGDWISYTPTYPSGYTSNPTYVARYRINGVGPGRELVLMLNATAHGAGSGSTTQMTLPPGITSRVNHEVAFAHCTANGSQQSTTPIGVLLVNDNTMTIHPSPAISGWTGTGGRSITGIAIIAIN